MADIVQLKTQATILPDLKQVTIPDIAKLRLANSFNMWRALVRGALLPLKLEDLIDEKLPRPTEDDPGYENWRAWSSFVRCWLLTQLSDEIFQQVERCSAWNREEFEQESQLPRYADNMFSLIQKVFVASKDGEASLTVAALHGIRRNQFPSAEKYLREWMNVIEKLRQVNLALPPYVAAKLMCFELREDAPIVIPMVEEVIKGDLTESKFTHKRFLAICNELLICTSTPKNTMMCEADSVFQHFECRSHCINLASRRHEGNSDLLNGEEALPGFAARVRY